MTIKPNAGRDEKQGRLFGRGNARLTTKEAAFHIGLSVRTLEGWRSRGRGPLAYKLGRSWFYYLEDIDQWARGHARGESL